MAVRGLPTAQATAPREHATALRPETEVDAPPHPRPPHLRAWQASLVPLALAVVLLVASALRLIGISYDFPYILDWDEQAEFYSTTHMLAAHSLDPHFYAHGPLLIYIETLWLLPYLAVRTLLGQPTIPAITYYDSYLATTSDPYLPVYGRLIFVAMGVGAVWLAFLVGRRLAGPWAGVLAATLLALSPLHTYESHFFLPDAPTSFFAVLTLLFTVRYVQRQRITPLVKGPSARRWHRWPGSRVLDEDRNLVLAVVTAALGAAVKYNAVALLLMPLLAVYLTRPLSSEPWPRRCVRLCVVAALVFLVTTPPAIINTIPFLHESLYDLKHYARYGGGGSGSSIIWYGQYLIEQEGLLVLPLAVIGLAVGVWRHRRRVDLLMLAMIVCYYLLVGVQKAHYARNLLVILPLLSVACACALIRLARPRGLLGPAVAALLAIVVLAALGQGSVNQARAFLSTPPQLVVQSWLRTHLPPHAVVLADGYTVPPVNRRDVTTLYAPRGVIRLTPDQMRQDGVGYVVLSNSLWYYLNDPKHLWSPTVKMVPLYAYGSLEVFSIMHNGT